MLVDSILAFALGDFALQGPINEPYYYLRQILPDLTPDTGAGRCVTRMAWYGCLVELSCKAPLK